MAFRHHASAAAFGGFLTRPFDQPLATQASSVLAPVGGYGSARVEGYRFEEIVSFDAGYTQVMGTQRQTKDGKTVHETLSMAVVEGLNILGIVTADRVVSRLASSYIEGDPADELPHLPIGSYFSNLRIAGVRIGDGRGELHPRPYLLEERTGRKSVLEKVGREVVKPFCDTTGTEIRTFPPRLQLPLFDLSGYAIPGATKPAGHGGTIEIPTFGSITLGELIVTPGERMLNMIVVDLHSPEEGMLVVGPTQGNGIPP